MSSNAACQCYKEQYVCSVLSGCLRKDADIQSSIMDFKAHQPLSLEADFTSNWAVSARANLTAPANPFK